MKQMNPKREPITLYGHVPFCCPVCLGRGLVAPGFYTLGNVTTSLTPDGCRACGGTGLVWARQEGTP